MAPLAGDALAAVQDPAVDDDAPADPGAEDDAEEDAGPAAGAEAGLGEGEAVGVVGHLHPAAEIGGQVVEQGAAVEAGGVGVLQGPGAGVQHAGGADAQDLGPVPGLGGQPVHQLGDAPAHPVVAEVAVGGHPQPAQGLKGVGRGQHDALDLGAPQVDPPEAHEAASAAGEVSGEDSSMTRIDFQGPTRKRR